MVWGAHLREDEHFVAPLAQLGQQLVEQHHLAGPLLEQLRPEGIVAQVLRGKSQ